MTIEKLLKLKTFIEIADEIIYSIDKLQKELNKNRKALRNIITIKEDENSTRILIQEINSDAPPLNFPINEFIEYLKSKIIKNEKDLISFNKKFKDLTLENLPKGWREKKESN